MTGPCNDDITAHKGRRGLTDAEVVSSRELHGSNVLTPPTRTTWLQRLSSTCRHWIGICAEALIVIAAIVAAVMAPTLGAAVWVIPAIAAVVAVLILLVGFFGGFNDPLLRILIMAFVLSMGISVYEFVWLNAGAETFFEPIGIIIALLLATGVGYALERSNEKTFRSLNEVNDDTPVRVVRNGQSTEVRRRDIVVGDIVMLDVGEEVPADGILRESIQLMVDESSLTGEPPIGKAANPQATADTRTYPADHIYKGTMVMEGTCVAEITAVGDRTESGKVFEAAQVRDTEATPLNRKLNHLATWITRISYAVAALVVVGRLIMYFVHTSDTTPDDINEWMQLMHYMLQTVMIAVTLIVVAVPEGLPMSVTLSLAFSMRSLMHENALPRTMHACETMGAATVICTDKTGTLTQNQMRVSDFLLSPNVEMDMMAALISTNTTADLDFSQPDKPRPIGNPTEGALLLWLYQQGFDYREYRNTTSIIDRVPFSTEKKYMSTTFSTNGGESIVSVKGAPELILDMCQLDNDSEYKAYIQKIQSEYQSKGLRTIAVAYGSPASAQALRWAGVFGISDPVREDVPAAIKECCKAGIEVKIVTGDTALTACEVGRQVGLWQDGYNERNLITGTEMAACSDEELLQRLDEIKIVSRARPTDKSRLVSLLRSQEHVVAVTGDGTNDAPALNAANVGLSMGNGTAVAKEASDMTILDNNFSTIVRTVLWGRSLYRNIQRFIMYQATINVVACLIVLIGAFTGTDSPLTVTQMLWVNLIMDTFAAIALASLPPQQRVMREHPRNAGTSIISRPMMRHIAGLGTLFTLLLVAILLVMQHSNIQSVLQLSTVNFQLSTYNGLSPYELSLFFTIFVMLQFWNMFNAKAFKTGHSAFHDLKHCRGFVIIAAVVLLGQIAIVQLGGQMFNVTPLSITDWLLIIGLTSPVMLLGELQRLITSHHGLQDNR